MQWIQLTLRGDRKISIRKDKIIAVFELTPEEHDPETGEELPPDSPYRHGCEIEYEVGDRKVETTVYDLYNFIMAALQEF